MKLSLPLILLATVIIISCNEKIEVDGNPCTDITSSLYQEKDGILIIELETGELPEGWENSKKLDDFLGNSYIQWKGNAFMSNPGPGKISYKFQINNPGTYRVQIRNYIAEGTSSTDHNDVWLAMPDADDYFGEKKGNLVYPKGSGKSPNPKGNSADGFFKIYNNTRDKWSWGTKTSDHDAHNIYATFEKAGIYTIKISGRSTGFAIDRLTLYKEGGAKGTDDTMTASKINCDE